MELKNAVAVCLISLFSATMVVLIARSLDDRAAARLEPQLAAIVEELQAIRRQGGVPAASESQVDSTVVRDGLVVYFLHGNERCPTCNSIESQAHKVVDADFGEQLRSGEIVWKVLNYERPAGAPFVKDFGVDKSVVLLASMKGGELQRWKRLDEVWALVGDKTAFASFVRKEIEEMLNEGNSSETTTEAKKAKKAAPVQDSGAPADLAVPPP